MRIPMPALLAVSLAAACTKPQPPASQAPLAPRGDALQGTVAEKIDAAQYSYLRLKTQAGDVWTAVPRTDKAVGSTVSIAGPLWMSNFKSATLGRSWERIAFGALDEGLPPGHPPVDAAPAPAVGKIPKADLSIAEVYARKAALKDTRVSVRGKVVKAVGGVMGKNWLHLRDGGEGDLTVASAQPAKVGETLVVVGKVILDRDLGSGYRYEVLIEDAELKRE